MDRANPDAPGKPLDPAVLIEMEEALHHPFGDVRIHTGHAANIVAKRDVAQAHYAVAVLTPPIVPGRQRSLT